MFAFAHVCVGDTTERFWEASVCLTACGTGGVLCYFVSEVETWWAGWGDIKMSSSSVFFRTLERWTGRLCASDLYVANFEIYFSMVDWKEAPSSMSNTH